MITGVLNKGKHLVHLAKTQSKNRLHQVEVIQNIVNLSAKHHKTQHPQKTVLQSSEMEFSYENKYQQGKRFSYQRWIRKILLLVFFTEVFQHQSVHCDYDINDMIATIQLEQEQILSQEEEKKEKEKQKEKQQQKDKQQQQQEKPIQQEEPKPQQQQSISQQQQIQKQMQMQSQSTNRNNERYGSQQQMLREQMDNSEQFGSVEQRMFIKQIQQRQHHQQQQSQIDNHNDNNNSTTQKKSQQQHPILELIIQQLIQNHQNAQYSQTLSPPTDDDIKEKQPQQTQEKKQNHGTIRFTSHEFMPLSKRLENFLGLRGVKIATSSLSTDQAQENQQIKKGIQLKLCNKLMDCKQIHIQNQQDKRDIFHHLNNFLNPPHIISSIEQARQLLKIIQKDENIISTYIPTASSQNNQPNPFDTFSTRYPQADPLTAEKQFRQYKYLSSSKKNCFVILRDKQAAEYLKVSTSKIGIPHVLYKYDKQLNGRHSQPNCQIDGNPYHVIQNFDKLVYKQGLTTLDKASQRLNNLTQRSFTLINSTEDIHDKIRHLTQQAVSFSFDDQITNIKAIKKLFVIKLNDLTSEKEINGILEKLSKINRQQVSIVKTQSDMVMRSLGVIANEEYATMRLFDLEHSQQPVVKSQRLSNSHFIRYVPKKVPFQIQSLSKWISNISPYDKPHEEHDHSVNKLLASHPGDFQPSKQASQMKLVLFYKDGCKGCKLMQDLLSRVVELKQRLKQSDTESARRIRREICLRYRIQNAQHISSIQISKFNILNDDNSIQVPQTTPTIYLLDEKNNQKVVLKTEQIFSHLNKINTNNGEIVQDYMVRELIDEIERGCRRFEALG